MLVVRIRYVVGKFFTNPINKYNIGTYYLLRKSVLTLENIIFEKSFLVLPIQSYNSALSQNV